MEPGHGYLRLLHMHAKYRSAVTVRGERGDGVCSLSVTNPRTAPKPWLYLTDNVTATEPEASPCPCHGPFEARSQHKATPYGTLWQAAVLCRRTELRKKKPAHWTN